MLKPEIIKNYVENLKSKGVTIDQKEAMLYFDSAFETVTNLVTDGNEINIRNFGTFCSALRKCKDMSKKSAERIQVFVLKFKPSVFLRNQINGKNT